MALGTRSQQMAYGHRLEEEGLVVFKPDAFSSTYLTMSLQHGGVITHGAPDQRLSDRPGRLPVSESQPSGQVWVRGCATLLGQVDGDKQRRISRAGRYRHGLTSALTLSPLRLARLTIGPIRSYHLPWITGPQSRCTSPVTPRHSYLAELSTSSLTVGSAVGSISQLFAKVKSIDAKHGKFDLLLCIGDFFGPLPPEEAEDGNTEISRLLNGEIEGLYPSVCCL